MDNKEFDDLMGDKLRSEQSFDFREPDWTDLSEQLDDHDRAKRIVPVWFWIGMLAIAALGTIFFLWNEQEQNPIQTLQSNTTEKSLIITDTIYKKVTITEYDTIRKIIVIEEVETRAWSSKETATTSIEDPSNIFINENTQDGNVIISKGKENCNCEEDELKNTEQGLHLATAKNKMNTDFTKVIPVVKTMNSYENIAVESQSKISLETTDRTLILPEYQDLPLTKVRKRIRKKRLWKKRFNIGFLGAWHLAETQKIPDYTPGGFFYQHSYEYGGRVEFELGHNFSLTGDITYQKLNLETNYSALFQDQLIVAEIPTGIDTLNVIQSNINYAVGLKYFLPKQRKIEPFLSLRLQAASGLKQKLSGKIPGAVYLEPVQYESIEKNDALKLQSLEAGIGIQYRLLPYLIWQGEGNYYFYLHDKEDRLRSNIGFKTSLLFHF